MRQIYPEPTVGALIINSENKILLVKSHKWMNGKYSVPGGHVEIGESFEEAIIREVKEETGLDIVPKRLFMIQECVRPKEFFKKKHFIFFDYICQTENIKVQLDERELQEYNWFKIEDIKENYLELALILLVTVNVVAVTALTINGFNKLYGNIVPVV